MDILIHPSSLNGTITAIPSKSQAHRLLICAAFADAPTSLECSETNRDIEATVDCLRALGTSIRREGVYYHIDPIAYLPDKAVLNCCESGSTLRFMLPIVGALGIEGTFQMEGRLPYRPLSPLWEEMERMGCLLSRPTENTILCTGKLKAGTYKIDGGVSSQFITGLLFALSLLQEQSDLVITGKTESKPYIDMTHLALMQFGVCTPPLGRKILRTPGALKVEGDWSNGAFFLAASAIGNSVNVENLNPNSAQGDKSCVQIMKALKLEHTFVDAADIPDLVPILSVVASFHHGAVFHNIQRLRAKESDRVESVCAMINSLGGRTESDESTLTIYPSAFIGGTVDSCNDHRIAMAAAIAATVSSGPVMIKQAQCVNKSYPTFWQEYKHLGGKYEQYIR